MPTEKMGFFSCVALIVGACIGSAIFSISGMTVFYAGASALVSWILAAVIYYAYGMLVAELAAKYPNSGGIFVFPRRSICGEKGSFLGFVSGWGYIVSNVIAISFSAIYVGHYLNIEGYFVSILAILLSVVIVLIGKRSSRNIQNFFVASLVILLLIYCGFAFWGGSFEQSNFKMAFSSGVKGNSGFLISVPLAMVAYGGCLVVPFMISEVKNPEINVHRSLFSGIGAVAVIYTLVIAAIVGTLSVEMISNNESLQFIPLSASISNSGLSSHCWLLTLVSLSGTLALVTTIIALIRVNARALQAISTDGFFHDKFAVDDRDGTAVYSIIVVSIAAIVLCFFPDCTAQLIMLGAALNVLSMSITCVSLIVSRKRNGAYSGYRAPLGSFLPFAVLFVFLSCYAPDLFTGGKDLWVFTAVVYLCGMVFYAIGAKTARRRFSGVVVHGKGRGRLFDIPTANMELYEGYEMPRFGVWEVKVFLDGSIYSGVTNIGLRPTDDTSSKPTIETLILNFSGAIYGKSMTIELLRFIRETRTFSSMEELRIQIESDIASVTSHDRIK